MILCSLISRDTVQVLGCFSFHGFPSLSALTFHIPMAQTLQFQLCSGLSCTWEEHLARGVKMLQASPMPPRAVCSCVFQILHTSEMNTSCLRCRILTDKTMEERIIHTVDQQHIGVVMAPLTCYLKINQHKPSIGIRHGYSDRSSFATKRLLST